MSEVRLETEHVHLGPLRTDDIEEFAMIAPDNERSIRVARGLGLSPLGRDVLNGTAVVVYAVTRERRSGAAGG